MLAIPLKHAIADMAATNVQMISRYSIYELTMKIGVQSPSCREGNQVSSKVGARVILRGILGLNINPDSIPVQDNEVLWNTVIEAVSVRPVDGVQVEVDA